VILAGMVSLGTVIERWSRCAYSSSSSGRSRRNVVAPTRARHAAALPDVAVSAAQSGCAPRWIFIFATTSKLVMAFGLGALLLGVMCFGVWSRKQRTWPFAEVA